MGAPRDSTALILARRRPSIQDKAPGRRSLPGQGGEAPARGACRDVRAEAPRPRREEPAGKAEPRHPKRINATQATRARALLGPGPTTLGTVYGPGPGAPVGVLK